MAVPPLDLGTHASDDFGFQVWSLCVGMKTTKARYSSATSQVAWLRPPAALGVQGLTCLCHARVWVALVPRFYVNDMANVERILSRLSRISDRRLTEKRHMNLRVRSMVDLPSRAGTGRLRSLGPGLARERSAVFTRNAPRLTGHGIPQEWMKAPTKCVVWGLLGVQRVHCVCARRGKGGGGAPRIT